MSPSSTARRPRAVPAVPIEEWRDEAGNAAQQYLTHGLFRYFGKLPPTLTARILGELGVGRGQRVVDLMCGSGTTLIEAALRGARADGVDANDLSVLIAKVKTTAIEPAVLARLTASFHAALGPLLADRHLDPATDRVRGERGLPPPRSPPPATRNLDHWFLPSSVRLLCRLRDWLTALPPGDSADLARVAFVASIRGSSRASVRTGRLFLDRDKQVPNPLVTFAARLDKVGQAVAALAGRGWDNRRVTVRVGDARASGLAVGRYDLAFCHPPYFALYRYSSDVLRLEMEWAAIDRAPVARREIEEGWKTTDATLVTDYVADLATVAREAARLTRPGGALVFVTADSTLRKAPLAVLDPLIAASEATGFTLVRRARREVRFAQASYHRSADAAIQRPDDQVVIFERRGG